MSDSLSYNDLIEDYSAVEGSEEDWIAEYDNVIEDNGVYLPDGFHVEYHQETYSSGSNFYDKNLTPEENAILNLEVTPQIERLMYDLAQEMETLPESLVEDEVDDNHLHLTEDTVDHERSLVEAIPALDEYFHLSEELDKAADKLGWAALASEKSLAWSIFKEEMNYNWLEFDRFIEKADVRLAILESKGKEVTEPQWFQFNKMKEDICKRVYKKQYTRYSVTRPYFDKAMNLTKQCKEFWQTEGGKHLSSLISARRESYKELVKNGHWRYVAEYWKLRNEPISCFYLSDNDNAEVDDPSEMNVSRFTPQVEGDTHFAELMRQERSDKFWEKWYSNFLDNSLAKAKEFDCAFVG